MKHLLSLLMILLLNACNNNNYTFNSNLNREAIEDYFKPSEVTVYEGDKEPLGQFELKGLVKGEACQTQQNGVPVTLADARTLARRAAADKNANGLIIKNCVLINEPTPGCFSSAVCIGQAIKTSTNTDN
ncbi:Rcs stress response system protein RcsF [uncultured Shewanella sp.]|uniref:Rcs stress response system protein RcsF n=1 Tax=uncultured Shewanella sp. TaxID=173975 RepID=UPI00262D0E09|nr:Rcs stress response system protein RcsF [uncultured Shewanella sp.]